jgi:hypothetical protein
MRSNLPCAYIGFGAMDDSFFIFIRPSAVDYNCSCVGLGAMFYNLPCIMFHSMLGRGSQFSCMVPCSHARQ